MSKQHIKENLFWFKYLNPTFILLIIDFSSLILFFGLCFIKLIINAAIKYDIPSNNKIFSIGQGFILKLNITIPDNKIAAG